MGKIKRDQKLNLEQSLLDEYYRVLFSRIESNKKEGVKVKSIAVTSAVGGEGKTTTIIQLAKVTARDFGKKVLLVEGDFRNPQLHLLVKNGGKSDSAILETSIKGLDVMPLEKTAKNFSGKGLSFANGLSKVIESASHSYDLVLVDCPPVIGLVDTQIIANSVDGIILVVRADGPNRELVANGVEGLPKNKLLGIVFNGMKIVWPRSLYEYNY